MGRTIRIAIVHSLHDYWYTMTYPSDIKALALELTDKCQASCPMCLRNHFGGAERNIVKNVEITLTDFKHWFPPEFIANLENFYCCGNLGDPAIAKDCLEIYQYVRSCNPTTRMALHTNGSMRTPLWWAEFAKINTQIIFGIDGFKGEHELYRKGTNWDKVIANATAFIQAGGDARADTIIFKHNEARIDDLKAYLESIGFNGVNVFATNRFYSMSTFPVQDRNGNHLYDLEPPTDPKWQTVTFKPNTVKLVQKEEYQKLLDFSVIEPSCVTKKEIYITANGSVYPCCWAVNHSDYDHKELDPNLSILRDRLVKSTFDLMSDIGLPNLHDGNIYNVMANTDWQSKLSKHWTTDKKLICIKNCASNLKSLAE